MNTIKRDEAHFNRSVMRLYNAYVNGRLNPLDCKACAAGNLFRRTNLWYSFTGMSSPWLRFSDKDWEAYNIDHNLNYSVQEIENIESLYMDGTMYESNLIDKEMTKSCHRETERPDHLNLKGLLLVIDYLGELHGIETPDIKELFANKELELELS